MKKRVKRIFTIVLSLCLSIVSLCSVTVSAATPDEVMPLYNNTSYASAGMSINSNGRMEITYDFSGLNAKTTKVVITTYIEKRTLGLFWSRVDNGQPDEQWVDTIYSIEHTKVRHFQLSSKGTYRVKILFKVYGSGGTADEIPYEIKDSY